VPADPFFRVKGAFTSVYLQLIQSH
jgi:hypothetical protein